MKTIRIYPVSRREFARRLGLGTVGMGLFGPLGKAQEGYPRFPDNIEELKLNQPLVYAIWRYVGALYYFDPIGLSVQPGETVGWVVGGSSGRTPTITAYHPDNDNHELRIPENAKPFDSGDPQRGSRGKPAFSWKFEVEGTYDYYSKWEEWRGMIGRIVVGKPGGPGEKPWGYGNKEGRKVMPPEVLKRVSLLDSQEIVRKKAIEFPYKQFYNKYPEW